MQLGLSCAAVQDQQPIKWQLINATEVPQLTLASSGPQIPDFLNKHRSNRPEIITFASLNAMAPCFLLPEETRSPCKVIICHLLRASKELPATSGRRIQRLLVSPGLLNHLSLIEIQKLSPFAQT